MSDQTDNETLEENVGQPRVIADYGGRRKILDRRKTQISIDHPDRRSGKDRRSGFDRRSAFNDRTNKNS